MYTTINGRDYAFESKTCHKTPTKKKTCICSCPAAQKSPNIPITDLFHLQCLKTYKSAVTKYTKKLLQNHRAYNFISSAN